MDSDSTEEPWKNKGWLENKYHSENLSQSDIAGICGVDQANIHYWMEKHGIEAREHSEAVSVGWGTKLRDEEWLRQKYLNEKLTIKEISSEFGYSTSTIRVWLKKHSIQVRGAHRRVGMFRGEDNPQWKGGDQAWRKSVKWREIREESKESDDNMCQDCGKVGGTLHSHHIVPVAEGGDKYSLDNLVTLCPDCHYARHS